MRSLPVLLTTLLLAAVAVPPASAAKVVHRKDSGKTITLAPGEKLTIRLTQCSPCGYAWRYAASPASKILKRTGDRYVDPPGTAVGGPGTRVIAYVAKAAGTTALRLVYVSPGGAKEDTFRLKVKVAAPVGRRA
jgi:predicted secreted protein